MTRRTGRTGMLFGGTLLIAAAAMAAEAQTVSPASSVPPAPSMSIATSVRAPIGRRLPVAPAMASSRVVGEPMRSGIVPRHKQAFDHGTSYAPPAIRPFGVSPPPSAGQITVRGDAHADGALIATAPINPAEGTRQIAGRPALVGLGPRLGRRLGQRPDTLAAGHRMGGGADYPSYEALIYDPRDLLDYRIRDLNDPSQHLGTP